MGEVAERSEAGEGKIGCKALSVTFGDSSPRGRAKGALTTAKVLPSYGRAALFHIIAYFTGEELLSVTS